MHHSACMHVFDSQSLCCTAQWRAGVCRKPHKHQGIAICQPYQHRHCCYYICITATDTRAASTNHHRVPGTHQSSRVPNHSRHQSTPGRTMLVSACGTTTSIPGIGLACTFGMQCTYSLDPLHRRTSSRATICTCCHCHHHCSSKHRRKHTPDTREATCNGAALCTVLLRHPLASIKNRRACW
jgi:hypothetical protein